MKLVSLKKAKFTKDELCALSILKKYVFSNIEREYDSNVHKRLSTAIKQYFNYSIDGGCLTIDFGSFNSVYGAKNWHIRVKHYSYPFNTVVPPHAGEARADLMDFKCKDVRIIDKRDYFKENIPYDYTEPRYAVYAPDGYAYTEECTDREVNMYSADRIACLRVQKRVEDDGSVSYITPYSNYIPLDYEPFRKRLIYEITSGFPPVETAKYFGVDKPFYRSETSKNEFFVVKDTGEEVPVPIFAGTHTPIKDRMAYEEATFDIIHLIEALSYSKLHICPFDKNKEAVYLMQAVTLEDDHIKKFKALLDCNRGFTFVLAFKNCGKLIDYYFDKVQKGEKIDTNKEFKKCKRGKIEEYLKE